MSDKAADLALRRDLLALEAEDARVRSELAADGSLVGGYHPVMEAVHRAGAARLREIIAERGWPGVSLVGAEGAIAAWRIAQHAIGEPEFMRRCLALVTAAVARGDAPPVHAAFLEDRIRVFEGRGQLYATQFDVDAGGFCVPYPIEEEGRVDARRAAVGLPPLAEQMERAEREAPLDDEARARREREYRAWLVRVGWRAMT